MSQGKRHRLRIDAYTPATLPMERLAEYMLRFAKILGEPDKVHFLEIESGSAVLVAVTDEVAVPKVNRRLNDAARGVGDQAALKAVKELDDMLAEDNAVGQLLDEGGAQIIEFPGRSRAKPLEYGPFREEGVLEGVVIKVGGTREKVSIWLQDRDFVHHCSAKRPIARQLAKHYDRGVIRANGTGSWMRLSTGAWLMKGFEIKSFELLDESPLLDVIKQLQEVQGADWGEDPIRDLTRLRRGEDLN